jgi:hypothetical protein
MGVKTMISQWMNEKTSICPRQAIESCCKKCTVLKVCTTISSVIDMLLSITRCITKCSLLGTVFLVHNNQEQPIGSSLDQVSLTSSPILRSILFPLIRLRLMGSLTELFENLHHSCSDLLHPLRHS